MPNAFAVAIVDGEPGNYSVVFPDFPGAGTSGDNVQEALTRAIDNLAAHIEGRLGAKLDLPRLRSADEIRGDPEFAEELAAGAISLVPVELPGRAVRINVTIDEGLLARVDQAAAREGETRSGFLATAVRARLAS